MRISALRIHHYRSLGDVSLRNLGPITILVGTNASGKSNIIDALRFLRDASTHSLDHALSSRGGLEIIRQYSPYRPYHISIRVEFLKDAADTEQPGYYEMTLSSAGGGNYRVEREEGIWHEAINDDDDPEKGSAIKQHFISRTSDGKAIIDNEGQFEIRDDELCLGHYAAYDLRLILTSPRFSAIYPNTLRSPARPDTDRRLKETGENWASILKAMRHAPRGRQAFASILEMMKLVMPTLVDVRVKAVGGYLAPQFVVKDSPAGKEHTFDPLQLSDGTLRIFGMLLALYQRPRSQVLALEEPEQTVNPAILAMLADAFKEVSHGTQLFITTHSPNLIDYFSPEQIRVVTMTEGETHASPVKASQIASVKERLTTLEELMAQGNLFPESSL